MTDLLMSDTVENIIKYATVGKAILSQGGVYDGRTLAYGGTVLIVNKEELHGSKEKI